MNAKGVKVDYNGSIFWLIFWVILFFPIALVLLFTGSTFVLNNKTYTFRYDGSIFWLCFWVLVFFPVAFLLIFLNGLSITTENPVVIEDDFEKL